MYNLYIMQINRNTSSSAPAVAGLARTQVYLTQTQQKRLALVARGASVTKSELIRRAVDQFLNQQPAPTLADKTQRLQSVAGMWAARDDLADPAAHVRALRASRF